MHFPDIWRPKFKKFPQCPTDSANSKETQSLGKNDLRRDKNVIVRPVLAYFTNFLVKKF